MNRLQVTLISSLLSAGAVAQDVRINGSMDIPLKAPSAKGLHKATAVPPSTIKLLKVTLSERAKRTMTQRAHQAEARNGAFAANSMAAYGRFPARVQLGMNNVPVLDQGVHGTCVTFAITAAMDAVVGQGDYISQTCSLQLGNYLAEQGYFPSGWDGSFGFMVINQFSSYGLINKSVEAERGCGGLHQYPGHSEEAPQSYISVEDYHPLSELSPMWSTVLDPVNAFMDRVDTNKTLASVKQALAEGDRLSFGVLLLDFDLGLAGAVGKKGAEYDTWVLTPEIARDAWLNPEFGGHEMVITGYDDTATATDDDGRVHKGLLTLRNSWSDRYGDQGNFYMSYDYFKMFVDEVYRLRNDDLDQD